METMILNKTTRDEISFISFIIPEFAAAYKMNIQKAYQVKYNFEVLDKFFFEHRDNFHYNK